MKKLFTLLLCFAFISVQAQWTGHSVITFEAGDNIYPVAISIDTVHYHHNIWQIGAPDKTVFKSAETAPNVIVTDTVHPCPASDTSVFTLKVPARAPIVIGGGYYGALYNFQFSYQLDKDTNSVALLEISDDNGGHWVNAQDSLPPVFYWPGDTERLSNTSGTWRQYNLSLTDDTASLADTFLFRFTFISGSVFANKDGWMIDDIFMEYDYESVQQIKNNELVSIYPNPSRGNFYIQSQQYNGAQSTIAIYNMQGQEVYETDLNTPDAYVHLPVPSGIYMLKYTAGGEYCMKKLVITQ